MPTRPSPLHSRLALIHEKDSWPDGRNNGPGGASMREGHAAAMLVSHFRTSGKRTTAGSRGAFKGPGAKEAGTGTGSVAQRRCLSPCSSSGNRDGTAR